MTAPVIPPVVGIPLSFFLHVLSYIREYFSSEALTSGTTSFYCISQPSTSMSFLESAAVAGVRRAPTTLPCIKKLTRRNVCRASLLSPSWHMRNLSVRAPATRSRFSGAHVRIPRTTTRFYIAPTERAPKHAQEATLAPKATRGTSKIFRNADEAVADIKSGSIILSAGFGLCGTAGEKCSRRPNHKLD